MSWFHRSALLLLLPLPWLPAQAEKTLLNQSCHPVHVVVLGARVLGAAATVDLFTGQREEGLLVKEPPLFRPGKMAPYVPPTVARGAGLPTIAEHKQYAWAAPVAKTSWLTFVDENPGFAGVYATLPPGGSLVFATSRADMVAGTRDEVTVNILPGEEKDPAFEFKAGGIQVTYQVAPDGTGQAVETLTQARIPTTAAAPLAFQVFEGLVEPSLSIADPVARTFCVIL